MTSFVVTGKLGSGKSLVTVGRIFDYLAQGRKVATNLDINLGGYLNSSSKKTLIRLPDKPSADDMKMLGTGNDSYNEEMNGLLVLDELGTWFNSRNWQDKTRSGLIDWFLHARKHGWDTMLIVQDISMIDAQLRGAMAEHLVICRRLDRVKIPFVGSFFQALGFKGVLPKIHRAKVHYGESDSDMVVDTWTYRGHSYYPAYDTKQIFSPTYPHGVYSLLSPWHTTGRFLPPPLALSERLKNFLFPPVVRPVPFALKPKHPLVIKIMRLPDPAQRLEFMRRFQACGAI
jgi:hypothetical protein